jgi:colanic acid/amylovoran biosynthesis glycosyltransferase
MKVLMYSETFGGATTTFVRNSVNAILESGHELLYLCSNLIPGSDIKHQNISFKVIPRELHFTQKLLFKILKHEYSILFLRNARLSKIYKKIIFEFQPDVIHCHFFNEALWLLENIDLKKQKVICQFHGYDASKLLGIGSYVAFIKKYNKYEQILFCFVSHSLKHNIEKAIHGRVYHSEILRCGIDTSLFYKEVKGQIPKIIESQQVKFLQISSLTEKKGHVFTLKALSIFKINYPFLKFTYTICGDGPLLNEIKLLILDLNLNENVILVGKVTPAEAKRYLLESNVFLHHSITSKDGDQEGIPNAIMEAMSMGIPVVSTIHSGIPELVTDDLNGLLVSEKDISAYVASLYKILDFNSYISESVMKIKYEFSFLKHKVNLNLIYKNIAHKYSNEPL